MGREYLFMSQSEATASNFFFSSHPQKAYPSSIVMILEPL